MTCTVTTCTWWKKKQSLFFFLKSHNAYLNNMSHDLVQISCIVSNTKYLGKKKILFTRILNYFFPFYVKYLAPIVVFNMAPQSVVILDRRFQNIYTYRLHKVSFVILHHSFFILINICISSGHTEQNTFCLFLKRQYRSGSIVSIPFIIHKC